MNEQDLINKMQRTRLDIEIDVLQSFQVELELEGITGGKTEYLLNKEIHSRIEKLREIENV